MIEANNGSNSQPKVVGMIRGKDDRMYVSVLDTTVHIDFYESYEAGTVYAKAKEAQEELPKLVLDTDPNKTYKAVIMFVEQQPLI